MAGKDVLGLLLYKAVLHSKTIVALFVTAGLLALLVLPAAERNNFFDENALLVGTASQKIGCAMRDRLLHVAHVATTQRQTHTCPAMGRCQPPLHHKAQSFPTLHDWALALLCRQYVHHHMPQLQQTITTLQHQLADGASPLELLKARVPGLHEQRFQVVTSTGWVGCTNVHTVALSTRGDGSEALALFTPVATTGVPGGTTMSCLPGASRCRQQSASGAATALAVGIALTEYLAQVPWLARDFVLVVPDARCGLEASVDAWLQAQQGRGAPAVASGDFRRAGALQQVRLLHQSTINICRTLMTTTIQCCSATAWSPFNAAACVCGFQHLALAGGGTGAAQQRCERT